MSKLNLIYLLTGSNIGDAVSNLLQASQQIQLQIGEVIARSSLYKTSPWGTIQQDDFLNQVLCVQTVYSPDDVMQRLLQIEQQMGRVRSVKNAPRIIDIDVLFYNNDVYSSALVTIPHPLLHERKFVLQPLSELAPDIMHPVLHKTIRQLLAECTDTGLVEKM